MGQLLSHDEAFHREGDSPLVQPKASSFCSMVRACALRISQRTYAEARADRIPETLASNTAEVDIRDVGRLGHASTSSASASP